MTSHRIGTVFRDWKLCDSEPRIPFHSIRATCLIRDEADYRQHINYIHWNPVRHGWKQRVKDWPYSSFHRYVRRGAYPENWGNDANVSNVTVEE